MANFETIGLQAVLEGVGDFVTSGEALNDSVSAMSGGMDIGAGIMSAAGDVITGALMRVGEIAVESLLAAGGALVEFFSDSFSGALEAEQTIARLGQVIESTGGIAGVTVGEAEALADEFKHLAGGSDDAVISIIDMGLRMGTISEDEMPAFIQSTLDLGAVMGDAGKAAQLMARAQEDPVGVLGQLRKAGILVNEETEEQIKAMVKAGDTAGAYALLMDRVGEATAGAAETMANTTAGQWAIFTETIADAGESIMMAFLPAINSIASEGLAFLLPLIENFASSMGNVITLLTTGDFSGGIFGLMEDDPIIDFLFNVRDGLIGIGEFVASNLPLMQETFSTVWASIQSVLQVVGDFVTVTLMPAIATIWEQTGLQLPTAQSTFEGVMSAIVSVTKTVTEFITNTLIPILTTAVAWVVENWPAIQATIEDVWAQVQSITTTVITTVQSIITTALTAIQAFWAAHGDSIMTIVGVFMENAQATIETAITIIQSVIETVLGAIQVFWGIWGDEISAIVTNVTEAIGFVIDAFAAALEGDWVAFGEALRLAWNEVWENIGIILNSAIAAVQAIDWEQLGLDILTGIGDGIAAGGVWLQDILTQVIADAINAAKGFLGIESPSKLAMRVIGEPFSLGIAEGIMAGMGDITSASQAVSTEMVSAASPVSAMSVSNTINQYYSPTYGATPVSPERDFAIMSVTPIG